MASQSSTPMHVIGQRQDNVAYEDRQAVRAIMYNGASDDIALIYIAKGNYYKLPGGGIEEAEDHKIAVNREILEETGCKIVTEEAQLLAKSEEWRNDLHQISFCYVAKLAEDTGNPELTDLEASEGLTHGWYAVRTALEMMQQVEPTSELGRFIKERDLFFLTTFEGTKP